MVDVLSPEWSDRWKCDRYAAVSRGRYDAQIYTNQADKLGDELSREVSKQSAITSGQSMTKLPTRSRTQQRKSHTEWNAESELSLWLTTSALPPSWLSSPFP